MKETPGAERIEMAGGGYQSSYSVGGHDGATCRRGGCAQADPHHLHQAGLAGGGSHALPPQHMGRHALPKVQWRFWLNQTTSVF